MKKKLFVFVPIFLVFILIFTIITPVVAMSENVSDKIFRLHILANSDSIEDQDLKLKVRDRVLMLTEDMYVECNTVDDAIEITKKNLGAIENIAQKVVCFYGYEYDVEAYVSREYFNTRVYDDFVMPAGMYDCLKIEIGEAKGHNWWCVMFPSVCISGCSDELSDVLTEEEYELVSSGKYIVRFKIIEVYEGLKSKIIS